MELIDKYSLVGQDGLFSKRGCYGNCQHCGLWSSEGCRVILEAPTVDAVEVVHGRWERMVGMIPPEYHGRHKCSCCGVRALDRKFHEELSNYCPNCGAKMDGDGG